VEADLLRFYGVDLLDHYRGRLTARRLRVLIQHLPVESALVRALHGEEAQWGLTEHLLASAVDQLAAGTWMFATVHTPEDGSPPRRPEPVPRPGLSTAEETTPAASTEQIAAFFGQST
jgi:hypothetical protein